MGSVKKFLLIGLNCFVRSLRTFAAASAGTQPPSIVTTSGPLPPFTAVISVFWSVVFVKDSTFTLTPVSFWYFATAFISGGFDCEVNEVIVQSVIDPASRRA